MGAGNRNDEQAELVVQLNWSLREGVREREREKRGFFYFGGVVQALAIPS